MHNARARKPINELCSCSDVLVAAALVVTKNLKYFIFLPQSVRDVKAEGLSKPRRRWQRNKMTKQNVISKTIAVHMRCESL